MNQTVYNNTVQVTCTDNDKVVEAEIDNYKPQQGFDAYIATQRIPFRWNGKVYVGNSIGLEFTSPGPDSYNIKRGRT